jgi:hypothetical protein
MKPMFTSEAISDDDVFREVFFLEYGSDFSSRRECLLALNQAMEIPASFRSRLFPQATDIIRGENGVLAKISSLLDECVVEIEKMGLSSIYSIRQFNDTILTENETYKSLYKLYTLSTKFYDLDIKLSSKKNVYNSFVLDNRNFVTKPKPSQHIRTHNFFDKIGVKGWKVTNFYIIFEVDFFTTLLETGLYFNGSVSNAVWYTWLEGMKIAALLYDANLYTWKETSSVY